MSARSIQIRAERREKQKNRWSRNEKRLAGTSRAGIAKRSILGLSCKCDGQPSLTGGRRPGELTLAE